MTKQPDKPADDFDLPFEEAYAAIEQIVEQLESGDLSLAESVSLFERGQRLLTQCNSQLDAAELRVSQLTGGDDNLKTEPLS